MFRQLILRLAVRNLRSDWFGTLCAVLGVALGTATVDVVLTLDHNTQVFESGNWSTDPRMPAPVGPTTVVFTALPAVAPSAAPTERPSDETTTDNGVASAGAHPAAASPAPADDLERETHEDYQIMRSAIRLGSLSAFLVGALIVFFTFRVVIAQRRREIALLRSLGATKKQVAAIFLTEAAMIGAAGALVGLVIAPPIALLAAKAGITTTGRSYLPYLFFPKKLMLVVAVVGGATAVLGVVRPLQDILRLDVASALQPRAVAPESVQRVSDRGYGAIAIPFMVLLYVLVRPFFREVLPSLAFFVLEAGAVCFAFTAMLLFVPRLLGAVGAGLAAAVPFGPRAERLLTLRRVQRSGHELSWSVSSVMMVFALLLALHILTYALKQEVAQWAMPTIEPYAYFSAGIDDTVVPEHKVASVPNDVVRVRYSGRTPSPNAVKAVDVAAYRQMAATHSPEQAAIAAQLGPGRAVLSTLMARRLGLAAGDRLRIRVGERQSDLNIVGISDLGYTPLNDTYRSAKTFVLISEEDFPLVAAAADQTMGGAYAFARRGPKMAEPATFWKSVFGETHEEPGLIFESGADFMQHRLLETDSDFVIFDLILFLTAVLAGVGIANSLVLAAHIRRREIGLYRVLGMTAGQVRRLFVVEGVFIGAVGGIMAALLGAPLGYLTIGALRIISAFDVSYAVPWFYPVLVVVGAVAISVVSSLYPALRAGRQSSTEALKYE